MFLKVIERIILIKGSILKIIVGKNSDLGETFKMKEISRVDKQS